MSNQIVRLLLVETDPAETRWIRRMLKPTHPSGINHWHIDRAANLDDACRLLQKNKCDVILLGLRSARTNTTQRLQKLRDVAPHIPVIATADTEDERIFNTACALIATHTIHAKRPSLQAAIAAVVLPGRVPSGNAHNLQKLTVREHQIFRLIAEGRTTKEVAEHLGISVKTGETHRTNLMRKLGLRSVSQLVRYAIRHEVVEA